MQPQVDVRDYSERSIVARTVPEDFLRNYSGHLVNLNGKWNPNLKDPSGQAKLGGWIFPKKNEQQVRQLLQMIVAGQVPQAPPSYQQAPSFAPTLAPSAGFLTSAIGSTSQQTPSASLLTSAIGSTAQRAPPMRSTPSNLPVMVTPSISNPLSPIMGLPGGAPAGYQQIVCTVLRPTVGATLHLNVAGQKIPLTVESASSEENIVNRAIVTLPDGQRTMIQLNVTGLPKWEVPGFPQEHSITI